MDPKRVVVEPNRDPRMVNHLPPPIYSYYHSIGGRCRKLGSCSRRIGPVGLVLACAGMLAMMGCDTNLRDGIADAEQASRAFTGSPLAGVRIVSDEGVFALSEAEPPKGFSSQSIGTLAWWNDASSQQLFLYSRLVITTSDMGHALINLERDLGIDPSFTDESTELKQAISKAKIEPTDTTTWQPATYTLALEIMGFDPSEFVDAVKALDPFTPECRILKGIVATETSMKTSPSPLKAILLASQASCGSGCNCTTTDVCKTARCTAGVCVIKPKDCSSDDLCVISSYCDPDTGRCVDNEKDCDDGILCNTDWCDWNTGECRNTPEPMDNPRCEDMLSLPEYLIPNIDDDNGNGIPDFDDPGPFPNDDELVWVPISTANCDLSYCVTVHGIFPKMSLQATYLSVFVAGLSPFGR